MVYEAMLLFGVVFLAEIIFVAAAVGVARVPIGSLATDATMTLLQQLWLFVFLGAYFAYFWRKSGQTLPMQTWRMRVVARNGGGRVSLMSALARYVLAWMWFVPGWYLGHALGLDKYATIGLMLLNAILWEAASRLSKDGQLLHDRLAGTQLISTQRP